MRPLLRAFLIAGSLATLPTLATAQVCGGTLQDTENFTNGSNGPGFSFGNSFDMLEITGGNPGGYLHNPNVQNFAAILRTSDPLYQGDYSARGVSRIGLDFRLDSLDFGDGTGFELSILLRDTKGTAVVDDDDYTYFVGPNVPLVGTGWAHVDFDIPSSTTDPVPAGWSGGWVGDLENFRPGITFQDVIQSVDKVEIWTLNPAFFAIFQRWDVGVDNVTIESADPSWCDVGLGSIPGFSGVPVLNGQGLLTPGSTVSLELLNARPNARALLIFGTAQANIPVHGGTLVPAPRVQRLVSTDANGRSLSEITVPANFSSTEIFAQYWVRDAAALGGWAATNGSRSPMLVSPPVSTQYMVTIRGGVDFNQINPAPLGNVGAGEMATIEFLLDSDEFVDSSTFPTRGYHIDQSSFSMTFDSASVGIQNPFPAGTDALFVIRDNDPAVDGFFLSNNTDGFPAGVPLDSTGSFGQFTSQFSVTYGGSTLPSLDIADAVGFYDFTGLSVFGFTIDDGPFNAMSINFTDMTIAEVP